MKIKARLVAVMVALNQLGNALTGGNPQESVSSRLADGRDAGSRSARFGCWLLEKVDFHGPERADHCDQAKIDREKRLRENHDRAAGRLPRK